MHSTCFCSDIALLLFGRGKISELMGDVAAGIKSFKKGMAEDEEARTGAARSEQASIRRRMSAGEFHAARSRLSPARFLMFDISWSCF